MTLHVTLAALTRGSTSSLSTFIRIFSASNPSWRTVVLLDSDSFELQSSILRSSLFPESKPTCPSLEIFDVSSMIPPTLLRGRQSGRIGAIKNIALRKLWSYSTDFILFIDDDIAFQESELDGFWNMLNHHKGSIVGCSVHGFDSVDFVTRSLRLAGYAQVDTGLPRNLKTPESEQKYDVAYVSGGFSLVPTMSRIAPFPQSYNETWIWCLINRINLGIATAQLPYSVAHLRSSFAPTSVCEMVSEQVGVLVGRLLKRFQGGHCQAANPALAWLASEECLSLCDALGPSARLKSALNSIPSAQRKVHHLSRELMDEIDISAHELLDLFSSVDWPECVRDWIKSYSMLLSDWDVGVHTQR